MKFDLGQTVYSLKIGNDKLEIVSGKIFSARLEKDVVWYSTPAGSKAEHELFASKNELISEYVRQLEALRGGDQQ